MTTAPRARLVPPLVAALLVLASCGGSDGSSSARRPPRHVRRRARAARRRLAATGGTSGRPLPRAGRPVYCGGGTHRHVALTFDDGPGPQTRAILGTLRRWDARATFFVVGSQVLKRKRLVNSETFLGAVGDTRGPTPRSPG